MNITTRHLGAAVFILIVSGSFLAFTNPGQRLSCTVMGQDSSTDFSGDVVCVEPAFDDAGQQCTASSQCQGYCTADSQTAQDGTCTASDSPNECQLYLFENGDNWACEAP